MSRETDQLLAQEQMREAEMLFSHRLMSLKEGESEVEKLAAKIEQRRSNVLWITYDAELELLTRCREIALRGEYDSPNKIAREDLVSIRKQNVDQESFHPLLGCLKKLTGFKTTQQYITEALDRALCHVDQNQEDWFYYQDWIFFHTKVVSKWPWMRNKSANAFLVVMLFFAATPFFFCKVLEDKNICGDPSTGINWLEGYYMASVTLSTVGYGDVTVEKDNVWFGTAYMMVSVCVSILAFSAAASDAFSPLERFYAKYVSIVGDNGTVGGDDLETKLRRIRRLKVGEILVHFVGLNMIGIIASRFFKGNLSGIHEGSEWTWGESVYWSVQSTTTIGYGDMTMSPEMKMFQVFYLCLGTFFVGNTLGKLAGLMADMERLRTEYAWQERQISNEMIRADQGSTTDTRVDQYEFVVASLLNLGKVQEQDIQLIMNTFRKLAIASGDKGYISLGKPIQVATS